ncbi:MAG: alpha/beta hydrolase [Pseudomonadota bacterium]
MQRTISFDSHDGLHLAAHQWGEPRAHPVLLLHGGGQTRHAWGGTAKVLAEQGLRAIALDMRGHGDSDWHPQGQYQIENFVADLIAVCDQIGKPPALVGASLGGIVALLACWQKGADIFSSLTLVDVTPRLESSGVERVLSFMHAHLDGFASIEAAAKAIADYVPERKATGNTSGLTKNLRQRDDGRYYWHWDPRFLDHIGHMRESDIEHMQGAARAVSIPALIVRGRMSDVVSEETVQEFLHLVPHAEYADVSGAGHMVAGDRNDAFTEAVCDFLNRYPVS